MRHYLEVMNVDPMAIEAHEKGEKEYDTIHTIAMDDRRVRIVKRSRVNNDLVVDLEFNRHTLVFLAPGDRPKRSLAISRSPGHLEIQNSIKTINGLATVTDTKELLQEPDKSYLLQTLFIVNEQTKKSCTTKRFFLPYTKTPPHLELAETTPVASPS